MLQRDYIRFFQYEERKKNNQYRKQHILSIALIFTIVIFLVASLIKISMRFLSYQERREREQDKSLQHNELIINSLPPKPKERWRYIEELKGQQFNFQFLNKPSKKIEIRNINQLNNNKCKLAIKDNRQVKQIKYHGLDEIQKTLRTNTNSKKRNQHHWMVQCGSFKNLSQAEIIRAQLAFKGFNFHIIENNGWNRVVDGPIKDKKSVDDKISLLKTSNQSNCILLH